MDFKKPLNATIKIVLPLAFGFLLLWLLYRKVDLNELMHVVKKGVRYDIILFSLLFGLLGNVIRGFRWCLLIKSLGEKFKKGNAVLAVLGNYAVNLVLPRVGEVWRCGVLTKYDKISFPKLFGTLLIDRVCDTLMVGVTTLFVFMFNIGFFTRFFASNPHLLEGFYTFFHSVWTYVLLIAAILLTWIAFTYWTHLFLIRKAKEVLASIWDGMKSLWLLENKPRFLLQTLLLWLSYFCFFYITFYAFDFTRDLGIRVGLIGFVMTSIAVAVPVQGGIGPWHFMVIATLVCFGVNETDAAAFALIVWTIQTIWTALVGVVGIMLLPVINKKTDPAVSK